MIKATSTVIAAVAALTLSAGAYAQSNNTLATPSTVSPAAAAASTGGYGTPGATSSESGTGAANANLSNSPSNSATSLINAPGSHNTLATPSTVSPATQ